MRNVAVIAHVDHGKTTIVDNLLRITEKPSESMDRNDLEKERGITILSKCTGIIWKNEKINIIDTPGHSDFGGEVERIMSMVDIALLIIDSVEGVKPQTRFVIEKAIKHKAKLIIVVNKMDREGAQPIDVTLSALDTINDMGYEGNVEEIPVLYASGRDSWAIENAEDENETKKSLTIILDYILKVEISQNSTQYDNKFRMYVSLIDRDDFLGRIVIGKIVSGSIKPKQTVQVLRANGQNIYSGRVTKVFTFQGSQRIEKDEVNKDDIVAIAGLLQNASATDTICDMEVVEPIFSDPISPSTMSVIISANNSPTAGKDGTHLTASKIKERLLKEIEGNVSIQIKEISESFEVFGRGELQIGILLENMRREGFELLIRKPTVVQKKINGVMCEPIEKVYISVLPEYTGFVIEELNNRGGELISMEETIIFKVPTRGLMGFHSVFISQTNGTGIMDREVLSYEPHKGEIKANYHGSLVSSANGVATGYALNTLQKRGQLFVNPGDTIYEGMVIGENAKEGDMEVNPTKSKQLSNMRASGKDESVQLTKPKIRTLEELLNYINSDEAIEYTPKRMCIRKVYLKLSERKSKKL